jgi:RNA polymerase sigma-70 factor (ECF subfamily)
LADKGADWEVLQHALTSLKKDYRQVVILRALKDFSVRETAEILGWTESKVRVTYHRALQKMKQSIGHDAEGVMFYEK